MSHILLRRRLFLIGLAIALFLTFQPIHGQAPPRDVAGDPDVQAAQRLFTVWLEGQMVSRHLPGIAIGVVSDQELIWSKGFGLADTAARVAMTPQTKFRMASHSKLFTATAIMQLRERGLLRLDDPGRQAPAVVRGHARRGRGCADHDRRVADA